MEHPGLRRTKSRSFHWPRESRPGKRPRRSAVRFRRILGSIAERVPGRLQSVSVKSQHPFHAANPLLLDDLPMRAVAGGGAAQRARPARADAQAGTGRIALGRQGGSGRVRRPWLRPMQRGSAGRVKLHRQKAFGDVLEARFGPKSKSRRGGAGAAAGASGHGLAAGHAEDACPAGCARDGCGGPGTLDMKAGVAMAFTAIEMLTEAGLLQREIVLLLNSDEEVGSPVSRPITERIGAGMRGRVCAGAGAGAGLQDSAQRNRQLAD